MSIKLSIEQQPDNTYRESIVYIGGTGHRTLPIKPITPIEKELTTLFKQQHSKSRKRFK